VLSPIFLRIEYDIDPKTPAAPVPLLQVEMTFLLYFVESARNVGSPRPLEKEVHATPKKTIHFVEADATTAKLIADSVQEIKILGAA
jgi:hypothetical protein